MLQLVRRSSGLTILEVVIMAAIAAGLIVPIMTLSRRNVREHRELMRRNLANGICLDTLERLKRYKVFWSLPGEAPTGSYEPTGIEELFGPVELDPDRMTLFDLAYLEQMRLLGMTRRPRIERTPVPEVPGLFELAVELDWETEDGDARRVRVVRLGYAP